MPKYIAEYLPRLNTTSISIQLPPNEIKTATIHTTTSSTSKPTSTIRITLKTPAPSISIPLPITTTNQDIKHLLKSNEESCVNLRLPSSSASHDQQSSSNPNSSIEFLTSQDTYRWTTRELQALRTNNSADSFWLSCAHCDHPLISISSTGSSTTNQQQREPQVVSRIYAMPSETWSELMEFWHCHKPDEPSNGSGSIKDRFDSFKPRGRDLFVGSYYFVLNSKEFGLSFTNSNDDDIEMDDVSDCPW
ncbi:unnamed protein product [Ambrosiozyma monospora]|uniref:Unnamed protein product n=1 Tax=Ambrosiozyma monospora TaxID=43982 RepID=A0ACB5UAX6_AMBMO|nr:unnamed protein product [Ambrosiozyma monospora]